MLPGVLALMHCGLRKVANARKTSDESSSDGAGWGFSCLHSPNKCLVGAAAHLQTHASGFVRLAVQLL